MFKTGNLALNSNFTAFKNNRYREIYAHELAHKNAAGNLAGPIVIEKDSNGIPVGGHVSIRMPVLDENNPQNAISDAKTVIKAALAPSNPSYQDYKVEAQARKILMQAEQIKSRNDSSFGPVSDEKCGKRLDYRA